MNCEIGRGADAVLWISLIAGPELACRINQRFLKVRPLKLFKMIGKLPLKIYEFL